jgi:hypothetical protein
VYAIQTTQLAERVLHLTRELLHVAKKSLPGKFRPRPSGFSGDVVIIVLLTIGGRRCTARDDAATLTPSLTPTTATATIASIADVASVDERLDPPDMERPFRGRLPAFSGLLDRLR